MPRGKFKPDYELEFLSVLTEDGELDESLEPDIAEDTLRRMHRTMLLSRRLDERMLKLQRAGRIGTFGPAMGQEGTQTGAAAALEDRDWTVPSYRETSVLLWRGIPVWGLLLYNAGYQEGGRIPDDINTLPIAIPVGSQTLHAVGIAYAEKLRGDDRVVMTFFGDGATSEGDFHEAMNFASVMEVPVVFLCSNNQYAISVPRDKQTHSRTLAQKALAYDMRGMQVDGNDVLAVYAAAREAVDRARSERQPMMIECVTYRLSVHTTADDPTKYRSDEEVEEWRKRDPIPRFRKYLADKGVLSEEDAEKIDEEVRQEIQEAWEETGRRMAELDGAPLAMFDHVLAEMPPEFERQRDALARELSARAPQAKEEEEKEEEGEDGERDEKEGEDKEPDVKESAHG